MTSPWSGVDTVLFDLDGTLLDSAPGIVGGFQHALRTVGIEPPDEATLRSDLGPPLEVLLLRLGVDEVRLPDAIAAYREFYLREGRFDATAYAGVRDLLASLSPPLVLATATAKRVETAVATLEAHDLAAPFAVVGGTDDLRVTKADTIAHTLVRLGGRAPSTAVMVGDRHSDITGGRACGLRTVGVTWGYGSRAELADAGADVLIDHPDQLRDLLLG